VSIKCLNFSGNSFILLQWRWSMKIDSYRIKHFVFEVRYPSNYRIPKRKWEALERFPVGSIGSGEFGIIGHDKKKRWEYAVELNRSHFSVENVLDFEKWEKQIVDFLNFLVKEYQIQIFQRFGARFYFMALDSNTKPTKEYAQIISKSFYLDGLNKDALTQAGSVVRSKFKNWRVRFGIFSSDESVMRKYHSYHDLPEFLVPSFIYDVDLSQENVALTGNKKKGFRESSWDAAAWVQDSYSSALDLVKSHAKSITKV